MLGPFARQRNWNVVKEQIFIFNFCNFLFLVFLFIFPNSKLLILRPNVLSEGLGAEARILQMFKPTLKRNWSFYENFSYIQTTKLNGSKRIKNLLTDEARLKLKALHFHIDCKVFRLLCFSFKTNWFDFLLTRVFILMQHQYQQQLIFSFCWIRYIIYVNKFFDLMIR